MKLTEQERQSVLWSKLAAHYQELLDKAHVSLEKASLSNEETAALRGRIKLLRQLLSLDKPIGLDTETETF